MSRITENTHINSIQSGDTVLHNDKLRTVCKTDLHVDKFMGVCLFGDSYSLGYKPVVRVHLKWEVQS